MKTEFVRWGNSLAIRVPSAFAKELGATEGRRAEMTLEDGALLVRIVKTNRVRRHRLEDLIERVTEENCHPETHWGPPVGNEAW